MTILVGILCHGQSLVAERREGVVFGTWTRQPRTPVLTGSSPGMKAFEETGSIPHDGNSSPTLNTAPGVIVVVPLPAGGIPASPLQIGAVFMVTGDIAPDSRLLATATLPSGEKLSLRDSIIAESHVRYGFFDPSGIYLCCQPASYPLTGFGNPFESIPAQSVIEVSITAPAKYARYYPPYRVVTTPVMRGVEQSSDRMTITLAGSFDAGKPAFVYFGLWPVPSRLQALSVSADHIVVDLNREPDTASWASGLYPVTVFQPDAVCDTMLLRFKSLLDP